MWCWRAGGALLRNGIAFQRESFHTSLAINHVTAGVSCILSFCQTAAHNNSMKKTVLLTPGTLTKRSIVVTLWNIETSRQGTAHTQYKLYSTVQM
jgi:hypothetical protein